ncbi:hypothetical protein HA466_0322510 [Hirschfeldia incana]|nr:hypothetical protein HA466_0322510 [Hirschfeldia incana]KAJ0228729.1 hypothetical protein HA466_0322510 [Hirschfeldia incana]
MSSLVFSIRHDRSTTLTLLTASPPSALVISVRRAIEDPPHEDDSVRPHGVPTF